MKPTTISSVSIARKETTADLIKAAYMYPVSMVVCVHNYIYNVQFIVWSSLCVCVCLGGGG